MSYVEKGDRRPRFAKRWAASEARVGMTVASMKLETCMYEERYLPVAGGQHHVSRHNSLDQTNLTTFKPET